MRSTRLFRNSCQAFKLHGIIEERDKNRKVENSRPTIVSREETTAMEKMQTIKHQQGTNGESRKVGLVGDKKREKLEEN